MLIVDELPTPKTLDEAIEQGMCGIPLCNIKERTYFVLYDFLAQKFTVAFSQAARHENEQALIILKELFEILVSRRAE